MAPFQLRNVPLPRLTWTCLAAVGLVLSACTPTEQSSTPTRYDNPLDPPASSIQLEALLVIDDDSGRPVLGIAGDMAIGNDDQIYVSDYQSDQIHEYTSEGAYIRTIGGPGNGPGEFQVPVTMRTLGDSLYVFDNRIYRVSVFSQSTGSFVRSWETEIDGWRAYRLLGVSSHGVMMWYSPSMVDLENETDDEIRVVQFGSTDPSDAPVIWRTPGYEYIPIEVNGMSLNRVKPFGNRSECAFRANIGYCMYSTALRVHSFSSAGDSLQTVSVHTEPQPVTTEDRNRALNRIPDESMRAQIIVSDTYPEISDDMIIDDSKRIWVRRVGNDDETVYWVLDPQNESTLSYTIPGDIRIKAIVRGRAVARVTHDDGSYSVGVYIVPAPILN